LSTDPLEDKDPARSTYCAMGNDPVNKIDPDGAETVTLIHENLEYITNNTGIIEGTLSEDRSKVYIGDNETTGYGTWVTVPSDKELRDFKLKMGNGIAAARLHGAPHAANNLKRWLDGKTSLFTEDTEWLRQQKVVQIAMIINFERFIQNPKNNGEGLPFVFSLSDGQSIIVNDYWEKVATGEWGNDLYYTWGSFTISTRGNITITRVGDELLVSGTLTHTFKDIYDWNTGQNVSIPKLDGQELEIDDASLRLYEVLTEAQSYRGTATWSEEINMRVPFYSSTMKFRITKFQLANSYSKQVENFKK
jgi:hypothetical protein